MAMNDVYQVQIYQNVGSEITMNVLHLREKVAAADQNDAVTCSIQYANVLYHLWAELLSEDWRVTVIKARRVEPSGGIPGTIVFGGAEAILGQVESEIVPSQAAILMSLYSNTPDRTGRGRQYLPGCAESIQNEGQMLEAPFNANRAAIESHYEEDFGPFGGGTAEMHAIIHGGGGSPTVEWDVVTAFLNPNLATQRRRRNFPGFGA